MPDPSTGDPGLCLLVAHPSPDLYGSDRMLLETVSGYRDAGWRVVVTLPAEGPLIAELQARGCEVSICPTLVLRKALLKPSGLLSLLSETVRSLRPSSRLLTTVRPDAVLVNTVTIPLWLVIARLRRRAVIAHVHEAEEGIPAIVAALLTAPLLFAHRIVVNSLATGAVVTKSIRRLERKIRLVYNGVPGPDGGEPVRSRLDAPVRLVLVGRMSPRKGTDVAIAALAQLRNSGYDARLALVGSVFSGYEWFERQLTEQIAELDLIGSVELLGFQRDVWGAYAHADIALVPSLVEPFGNASVEAQLAGRPVVVSATQGLTETVADGQFGALAEPGDAAALAKAIAAIIDDWPASVQTAERARQDAITRFSPLRYQRDMVRAGRELVR